MEYVLCRSCRSSKASSHPGQRGSVSLSLSCLTILSALLLVHASLHSRQTRYIPQSYMLLFPRHVYTCTSKLRHDVYMHVSMRDAEGRKKEASKVKQTTRQSNTAHPRQSQCYRDEEGRKEERTMSCIYCSMLLFPHHIVLLLLLLP